MSEEKKMTSYERKMEARKQQAAKEKKEQKRNTLITVAVAAVIVVAILAGVIATSVKKNNAVNATYITVGDYEVTKVEYDYYYYDVVNTYLNLYSGWLPYMGLDTSKDFAEQQYDENMTWKDAFDEMTVAQIQQVKALNDEAAAKGFVYDRLAEDYANSIAGLAEAAAAYGLNTKTYYKAVYGDYASEKNLKPFMEQNLIASAYSAELFEQNRPDEAAIDTYYEEHKAEYDLVDYYETAFVANVGSEYTDEQKQEAMDEKKALAEEMIARLDAGEAYETLCEEYFPTTETEETEESEETEETEEAKDKHFCEDHTSMYMRTATTEWLTDESRKAGDYTLIEDTEYSRYMVVQFVDRTYDETCREAISNTLATEKQQEYLNGIIEDYEVVDVKGELVYLTLPEASDAE